MNDQPRKQAISHALTATLMALVCATAACAPATEFDREAWRTEGEKDLEQTKRWAMADTVLRHITPGMAREQVIAELGQPDSSTSHAADLTDIYYLGVPDLSMHMVQLDLRYSQQRLISIRYTH